MSVPTKYGDAIIDSLIDGLSEGKSLSQLCKGKGMPDRRTVQRWANGEDDLAERVREAREIGYHARAERAVEEARSAKDPIAGRLAFDAERWYLGKLSNAFREKPIALGVQVNVGERDDAFAAVSGALDRAAAAISAGSTSTSSVAPDGAAGSDHPSG